MHLYVPGVRGKREAVLAWIEMLPSTRPMVEPLEFWEAYGKSLVN